MLGIFKSSYAYFALENEWSLVFIDSLELGSDFPGNLWFEAYRDHMHIIYLGMTTLDNDMDLIGVL